jgi:hypothetical protein
VNKFNGAIDKYKLVQFYYQSDGDKIPTLRIVEPYLIVIDKSGLGNIKLVGFPINRTPPTGELGHYLFDKLDIGNIKILDKTFDRLQVEEWKVYKTQVFWL